MKQILILRTWQDEKQSQGELFVRENGRVIFQCKTIELGWRDNKRNISCIPEGEYPIRFEYSPRFKRNLWEIHNVPGRSETKIHSANYYFQLNGCIAVGRKHKDLNKDGYLDVTSSRETLQAFHDAMGNDTEATIQIHNLHTETPFTI